MMGFEIAITCLALNIFKEARGEPIEGQQAVAFVTLNRSREQGKDICTVVFEPDQFSWTATDAHNGVLLKGKRPNQKSEEWTRAHSVAIEALTAVDFTNGATYFHEVKSKPGWAKSMTYSGRWGNHYFYRAPK